MSDRQTHDFDKGIAASRTWDVIGWDGILPLVPACSPIALSPLVGKELSELVSLLVVVPAIAILRASYANRQLARAAERPRLGRKLLMAAAIVALLMFDGLVIVLISDQQAPVSVWGVAAGLYAAYLVCILGALRRERRLTLRGH